MVVPSLHRMYRRNDLLRILALALLYLALAKTAFAFTTMQADVTTLWPSSGLALAILLLYGMKLWPGVFIGAFAAGLMAHDPIWLSALAAAGNTMEPMAGVWLLRRVGLDPSLRRLRDYYFLILAGAMIAPLANAILVPASLVLVGAFSPQHLLGVVMHWWMGHALGVLLLTPMLLVWKHPIDLSRPARWLEALALLGLSWYCGMVVFLGMELPLEPKLYTLAFWTIPFLIWAALRFGLHGLTVLLPLFFVQSLASAMTGQGMFANDLLETGLLNFGFFHLIGNSSLMTLGIVLRERRDAEQALRLTSQVFQHSSQGILITDSEARIISVNNTFTVITGFSAKEAIGRSPRMLRSGKHDEAFYRSMWSSVNTTGKWSGEVWNRRKDGSLFVEWLDICAITDPSSGRVEYYLGLFLDITDRKAAEDSVRHLAQHDFLTDLPNRLLFADRFSLTLAAAKRNQARFVLFYLDLDGFKKINDTFGHNIGDLLLKEVAVRLTDTMRATDTICRLGGDEFVILVPDFESADHAGSLACKVLDTIRQPYAIQGHEIVITASIGLAVYPDHGEDMDSLIRAADGAMYRSKDAGGNQLSAA